MDKQELETRLKLIEIEQNAVLHALEKKFEVEKIFSRKTDSTQFLLILLLWFFNIFFFFILLSHLIEASK